MKTSIFNIECLINFSSHTSLRRHEQKHQGVNYKCSKCLREFNDPSNLRRHEAACSGEKSDEPLTTQLSDIIEDQKPPKEKTEKKKDTEEQIKPHSCGYCHKVRSLTFKISYNFYYINH